MPRNNARLFRFALLLASVAGAATARGQQWTAPTAAELSMTSFPEVPGAPALMLYKEETQEDSLRMWSFYYRVKVLTEGGKDYANVELPYLAGSTGFSLDSIAGRTVHSDGTIVPFAGKPYDKLIEKAGGRTINAKVFSLPDVQPGSILEYRYKLRYDDAYFTPPEWDIQSDLFLRKGHFVWKPTHREVISDSEGAVNSVAWTPILPPGAAVKQGATVVGAPIELTVTDVPPLPHESDMPPMDSVSYRVMFYYTGYKSAAEYWKNAGKRWSNDRNKFMNYGDPVKAKVQELILPGDTEEQKVQKIYAFIGTLDNTVFSRNHTAREDQEQGFAKEVNSVNEVLKRKRGTDDQLTELFVAMVRAAGVKAYLMGVSNRDRRFFILQFLSLNQIDDYIAIVPLNGKDVYFDPGQRYCAFGHLSWKHTFAGGLRQAEGGAVLASTPAESYKEEHVSRIASLTLDDHGVASGTVTMSFTGDRALFWRQEALRGDDTSLNKDLRTSMENTLPAGMEVRVTDVQNLTDAAQPLKITYEVKGGIGSPTGKRLLIPANLFEVNSKAKYTPAKRDIPVDLHYSSYVQDAVRFTLPPGLVVESAPPEAKEGIPNEASYTTSSKATPTSITLFRNLVLGRPVFTEDEYASLRQFYNKLEAKDQESLVLTRSTSISATAVPAAAH